MSIRARLFLNAVISSGLMLCATVSYLWVAHENRVALDRIYFNELEPKRYLDQLVQEIEQVRVRVLGQITRKTDLAAALEHAREVREEMPSMWAEFVQRHKNWSSDPREEGLQRQFESSMPVLLRLLDSLIDIYRLGDEARLSAVLYDEDYYALQYLSSTLDELSKLQAEHAQFAYAHVQGMQSRANTVMLAVLGCALLFFVGFSVELARYVNRRIDAVDQALQRVAEGDLDAGVQGEHGGEIGRIARSLRSTLEALKADRESIRQLNSQNSLILSSIAEGIYGVDAAGAITFVNPAAERMLGYSAQELIGRQSHATLHHSHADGRPYPREDCPMYRARERVERVVSDNEVFWRKDGSVFPVEFASAPMMDDGRVVGGVVAFRDISARKARQAELEKTINALRELNRQLEQAQNQLLQSEKMASIGQLAAGVAHEINNPIGFVGSNLGSLKEYAEKLLAVIDAYERAEARGQVSAEALPALRAAKERAELAYLREDLSDLLRESQDGLARVKRIVQDLKDFSHVDEAEWQEADLHAGLESTLNVVWNELKYKATVEKGYGELPTVRCIPAQINQVFMNLLVNAAQAIEGSGVIRLRSGTEGEGWVWVEVSDTGRGMSEAVRARIFEPFFTTKPVGKGTGLGLSLSSGIVAKHGGRIEVTSTPGEGSVFRVWLPVVPDEARSPAEQTG